MDRDTILKIAKLCKLRLTDEEIEMYKNQFEKILNHMKEIEKVDVDGIEPYMTPVTGQLRTDEIKKENILDKKETITRAYEHNDNYILVPKVSVK